MLFLPVSTAGRRLSASSVQPQTVTVPRHPCEVPSRGPETATSPSVTQPHTLTNQFVKHTVMHF